MICLHFGRHCEVLYTSPTQRASNPTRSLVALLCYIHQRCSFCWKLLNKNLLFAEVKDLADPVVVPVLDLHVRLRKRLVISRNVSNIQYSWQLALGETRSFQIRGIVLNCGSKILNFLVQTCFNVDTAHLAISVFLEKKIISFPDFSLLKTSCLNPGGCVGSAI